MSTTHTPFARSGIATIRSICELTSIPRELIFQEIWRPYLREPILRFFDALYKPEYAASRADAYRRFRDSKSPTSYFGAYNGLVEKLSKDLKRGDKTTYFGGESDAAGHADWDAEDFLLKLAGDLGTALCENPRACFFGEGSKENVLKIEENWSTDENILYVAVKFAVYVAHSFTKKQWEKAPLPEVLGLVKPREAQRRTVGNFWQSLKSATTKRPEPKTRRGTISVKVPPLSATGWGEGHKWSNFWANEEPSNNSSSSHSVPGDEILSQDGQHHRTSQRSNISSSISFLTIRTERASHTTALGNNSAGNILMTGLSKHARADGNEPVDARTSSASLQEGKNRDDNARVPSDSPEEGKIRDPESQTTNDIVEQGEGEQEEEERDHTPLKQVDAMPEENLPIGSETMKKRRSPAEIVKVFRNLVTWFDDMDAKLEREKAHNKAAFEERQRFQAETRQQQEQGMLRIQVIGLGLRMWVASEEATLQSRSMTEVPGHKAMPEQGAKRKRTPDNDCMEDTDAEMVGNKESLEDDTDSHANKRRASARVSLRTIGGSARLCHVKAKF